ncbi:uncharacterized protein [Rutidosis leptorrhynchoides]|uniref:uncharacterized protein isoform X2 n=1 Tax=Rutidosis leptorrhynchoides TaxID=125765 RepID=UPI003A9946B3
MRNGFYDVYRAEIEHLDKENFVSTEEKNKSERPKKRTTVLINRLLHRKKKLGEERFRTEFEILATCKHRNIVSLLGFCNEDPEKILIIEDASNGSVAKNLINDEYKYILTWEKRLKICLDVAYGLKYLHHDMEDQYTVLHLYLSTYTIALDENFGSTIVDFQDSAFLPPNQDAHQGNYMIGGRVFADPDCDEGGSLKRESDVYKFGVVMFEILCGRLADDEMYTMESKNGLAHVARLCFRKGTIMEMIDPVIKEELDYNSFIPTKGANKDSIDTFVKIAYKCLAERQYKRPTMKHVVKELEKALSFQKVHCQDADQVVHGSDKSLDPQLTHENRRPSLEDLTSQLNHLKIRLHDITLATNSFSRAYRILRDDFYDVYRAEIEYLDNENFVSGEENNKSECPKKRSAVLIKRLLPVKKKLGEEVFRTDIDMFATCKHHNIVTLLGFCIADHEKILIIEDASNGHLVKYLRNYKDKSILTWEKRLKICLDIAYGLKYLHHEMEDQMTVIHSNFCTYSIALDENFGAKIAHFGLSEFLHPNQDSLCHDYIVGSQFHIDPEYGESGLLKRKSDVYSFGVVLFEIICGRLASDRMYKKESKDGLAYVARQCVRKGTMMEIVDPIIKEENDDNNFLTTKVPNKDSIETFVKIAYWCLSETQDQRPTMKDVVKELEKALSFQQVQCQDSDQVVDGSDNLLLELKSTHENPRPRLEDLTSQISHLKIRLHDITSATNNFSEAYMMKRGKICEVYSAELEVWDEENFVSVEETNKSEHPKKCTRVFIKRFLQRKGVFRTDLEMLATCKHHNIVTLLGFCEEDNEKILVVEGAYNGYLFRYLLIYENKYILSWEKRLKICLDVAYGLKYLHHEMEDHKSVIIGDFSTFSIALDENFVAKIVDFKHAVFIPPNQEEDFTLKRESDVYCFGLVLFELFCGRLADDEMYTKESKDGLAYVARQCFHKGTLMEMIDPMFTSKGVNKDSVDTFVEIAYRCLAETQNQRPTMKGVVKELEKALSFQEQTQCQEHSDQVVDGFELTHENSENPFEHLRIRLSDTRVATDNFSERYLVRDDDDCYYYRAELEHFDQQKFGFVKEKNRSELPKKRSTVNIKRILGEYKDGIESLYNEIEMLTTCKHPNIVTLVGFFDEDLEMILVFEIPIHETLFEYLFFKEKAIMLTWSKRLRICLEVAYGLKYLHYEKEDQKMISHCGMFSTTIIVDENFGAKICDFRHSRFLHPNRDEFSFDMYSFYKTRGSDWATGKCNRKIDVYSFGVILFEIACGKFASDEIYTRIDVEGLAYVARKCFYNGTLKEMIDPIIKEESLENSFTLSRGPNENSLDAFLKIVVACVDITQDKRPTMKIVVKELEKALSYQENHKDPLRISLEDVQLATKNFHEKHCVGHGGFGKVYKGKLSQCDHTTVAKRLDIRGGQGEKQFQNELQILSDYKHSNIISLVGYCAENDAKIIVYEYAPRGSLDRYLSDTRLDWMKRLNICIDVATALDFLHRGIGKQATVIHRDIKTENILLMSEWNAKLADFGLSLISGIDKETDYVIDGACGTPGYVDPLYVQSSFLTKESDIYSFGVVLFEILCGRPTYVIRKQEGVYLPVFIKDMFEKGTQNEAVFGEIKEQIKPEALSVFQTIAYKCLNEKREDRPTAEQVVMQLKKAMELQISRGDGASSSATNTPNKVQD